MPPLENPGQNPVNAGEKDYVTGGTRSHGLPLTSPECMHTYIHTHTYQLLNISVIVLIIKRDTHKVPPLENPGQNPVNAGEKDYVTGGTRSHGLPLTSPECMHTYIHTHTYQLLQVS